MLITRGILLHCVPYDGLVLFQQIHPDAFQTIFQNSLEPDVLNKILEILQRFYTK